MVEHSVIGVLYKMDSSLEKSDFVPSINDLSSIKGISLHQFFPWLKPVSTLERNVLITRIDTTTLYHLTAMLWYHIKHQLLLKRIRSFL